MRGQTSLVATVAEPQILLAACGCILQWSFHRRDETREPCVMDARPQRRQPGSKRSGSERNREAALLRRATIMVRCVPYEVSLETSSPSSPEKPPPRSGRKGHRDFGTRGITLEPALLKGLRERFVVSPPQNLQFPTGCQTIWDRRRR